MSEWIAITEACGSWIVRRLTTVAPATIILSLNVVANSSLSLMMVVVAGYFVIACILLLHFTLLDSLSS
jgi:hypothetical protein